jgi:hypothetical protein
MQDVDALARLATKPLAEELGDISLVIDNQDAYNHAKSPQVLRF